MLIYRGGNTIYVNDKGTIIQSPNLSLEEFQNLKDSENRPDFQENLYKVLGITFTEQHIYHSLSRDDRFTVKGESVYRKGINLSLPSLLADRYAKADEKEFEALDNFWKWCTLNPDKRARQDLFGFLQNGGWGLTQQGFIVAHRNVDIHDDSNPNDVIYTDQHTKKFRITIGNVVTMPRGKCNADPDVGCSTGLHLKSKGYNLSLGNVVITCLLNPKDVVAVPKYDTTKLRCCQYLPIGVAGTSSGRVEDVKDLLEYKLEDISIQDINRQLSEISLEEYTTNKLDIESVGNFVTEYNESLQEKIWDKIVDIYEEDEEDGEDAYEDWDEEYD